jgi:hypothetical protein
MSMVYYCLFYFGTCASDFVMSQQKGKHPGSATNKLEHRPNDIYDQQIPGVAYEIILKA